MTPQEARELLYIDHQPGAVEALQLKFHILSGESTTWCVSIDPHLVDGTSQTFDTFEAANEYFNQVPDGHHVRLDLWTRISTAVTFRMKGQEVIE